MAEQIAMERWVAYNHLAATYDTPDGTAIPAEQVENVQCLADVMGIALERERQRKEADHAA